CLRESPAPCVLVGKDGWLFYAAESSIDDFRHTVPLTDEQLESWALTYRMRKDWLARLGIHYLAFIAPSKHSIYPEMLPSNLKRVHAKSRYDKLAAHSSREPDIPFLDLRGPLLAAKPSGRL